MNDFIQAIGGLETIPYIIGALVLILVLLGAKWIATGNKSVTQQPSQVKPGPEPESAPEPETTQEPDLESESAPELETTQEPDLEPESAPELETTQEPDLEPESAPELETTQEPDLESESAPEFETTQEPDLESESAPELETTQEPDLEPEAETTSKPEPEPEPETTPEPEEAPEQKKARLFSRIKQGLSRTKSGLTSGLSGLLLGAKEIDEDLLEEIETQLLMADVGMEATTEIIQHLTDKVERKQLGDADALYDALKLELAALLNTSNTPLVIDRSTTPYVILMIGVNGVGKTTTIGKLAKRFQSEGRSVMLAAGDTFRAAAVEQLEVWGERNAVPVVAQHTGADSASVIFDAVQSAQSKGIDIVIADTAGRLQNKANLMAELEKVVRVMRKLDATAPHEVMLVLDAGTGQNAISQAKLFGEAVGVSGITLTKLDGTAKGGIIFAIAKQMQIPIRYIGVGEQIDDLRPFDADEFVMALFENDD